MTEPKRDPRRVQYFPLEALQPDPRNPKAHDEHVIGQSIERFSIMDLITRDERTGYIVSGHGRWNTLREMRDRGDSPPEGVSIGAEGTWLVPVITGWASRSDAEAGAALIALNRTTEIGGWQEDALIDLLQDLAKDEHGLDGIGYYVDDIEALQHELDNIDYTEKRKAQYEEGAERPAKKRTKHLDLIFSTSAASSALALTGYAMGWNPGVITSAVHAARLYVERYPRGKPIMFMDNEWHSYDHEQHVAALAEFHPKYATVRDLVTRKQAAEAGIVHYTVEQTLEMAAEISEHCDNVILIPKYDCIDRLPREINGKPVVLGYSVESSYGGTEIPPERFKGHPVHLLGGPWKKQRAILNILGDNVVSLDNNNLLMISRFGQVNMPSGNIDGVTELTSIEYSRNWMIVACVMSLANIMHEVITEYGVEIDEEPEAVQMEQDAAHAGRDSESE